MTKKKVLVAMSGGTDSSAVCMMLQEAGYEVSGLTLRVWDLPRQLAGGGDVPDFIQKAQRLAGRLGIPHRVVDVRERFRDSVVRYFLDEYENGRTPNPCVVCNRDFKFRLLVEEADRQGCQWVATGHYVKTARQDGRTYLLMGDDPRKDQSYFLWRVPQEALARCVFPLGGMEKTAVRKYLCRRGFEPEANQGESMEICFVEGDYRDFLLRERPSAGGEDRCGWFTDTTGRKLGEHRGVPFYTVGQRKGLGIALGKPAYVLRLNAEKKTVVLGDENELKTRVFFAEDMQCVCREEFFGRPDLTVRIRYHSQPVACSVNGLPDGRLLVRTAGDVSAVTPGQSAVFYVGKRLVGGAVIASQKGIGLYAEQ